MRTAEVIAEIRANCLIASYSTPTERLRLLNEISTTVYDPEATIPEGALGDVLLERRRQDEKWGEQNHPDGTGEKLWLLGRDALPSTYPELRDEIHEGVDRAAGDGIVNWAGILCKEVFEALAESDAARLRAELVQTAAVAVAWADALDRRAAEATR